MNFFVTSVYRLLSISILGAACGTDIVAAMTGEGGGYSVDGVVNEAENVKRQKLQTRSHGERPVFVLVVPIPRDEVFYCLVETWKVLQKTNETLMAYDILVAIVDVAEHPGIAVAPSGVVASKPLIDDRLVRPSGGDLCQCEEEQLLRIDHVSRGSVILHVAGVERHFLLVNRPQESFQVEQIVEPMKLPDIKVRHLVHFWI